MAWAAERREVLAELFFMLTLLAYALYVERPSLARYLAVAGCLALGLMSKAMLVTARRIASRHRLRRLGTSRRQRLSKRLRSRMLDSPARCLRQTNSGSKIR